MDTSCSMSFIFVSGCNLPSHNSDTCHFEEALQAGAELQDGENSFDTPVIVPGFFLADAGAGHIVSLLLSHLERNEACNNEFKVEAVTALMKSGSSLRRAAYNAFRTVQFSVGNDAKRKIGARQAHGSHKEIGNLLKALPLEFSQEWKLRSSALLYGIPSRAQLWIPVQVCEISRSSHLQVGTFRTQSFLTFWQSVGQAWNLWTFQTSVRMRALWLQSLRTVKNCFN